MPKNPKVYMDFTIGSKAAGRVVFELYTDLTPKTAENFRGLSTGEYGQGKISKRKLHYLGCKVHRIVDDFVIQAGDIVFGDGSGGESIYGTKNFPDENFTRRHAHAGLLSMANSGKDTNSSQFFVTLKPAPHLDGKHVVFGQVVSGMDVIRAIARVPTDLYEHPRIPVHIFDCGQMSNDGLRPLKDIEVVTEQD
jgi:cyclophilin family peptidyl-prolyl cis-trans isomerase